MKRRNYFIWVAVILVATVPTMFFLPPGERNRAFLELPALGALLGFLSQLLRDQIAHDRSLLLLEAQNSFSIGATSHMAIVAFDKHVKFCEQYVAEMFGALTTLYQKGPTTKALDHSTELYQIRQKWSVWLTPALQAELEPFEDALRKIGALRAANDCEPDQARSNEMNSLFIQVLGLEDSKEAVLPATVVEKLRKVLGIEELTSLRSGLVSRARKEAEAFLRRHD
jgi:hypothetical protein